MLYVAGLIFSLLSEAMLHICNAVLHTCVAKPCNVQTAGFPKKIQICCGELGYSLDVIVQL